MEEADAIDPSTAELQRYVLDLASRLHCGIPGICCWSNLLSLLANSTAATSVSTAPTLVFCKLCVLQAAGAGGGLGLNLESLPIVEDQESLLETSATHPYYVW